MGKQDAVSHPHVAKRVSGAAVRIFNPSVYFVHFVILCDSVEQSVTCVRLGGKLSSNKRSPYRDFLGKRVFYKNQK
jgi:hypothetical protein